MNLLEFTAFTSHWVHIISILFIKQLLQSKFYKGSLEQDKAYTEEPFCWWPDGKWRMRTRAGGRTETTDTCCMQLNNLLYPSMTGSQGSSLSRDTHTSLSLDTSSAFERIPEHSWASWVTMSPQHPTSAGSCSSTLIFDLPGDKAPQSIITLRECPATLWRKHLLELFLFFWSWLKFLDHRWGEKHWLSCKLRFLPSGSAPSLR